MNLVVNLNICRVCLKSEDGSSLLTDSELQTKFLFTTRLKLNEKDNMPTIICSKCVTRLKIAYEFVQLAHSSEKNLRTFLAKINNDFHQVTNTGSDNIDECIDDDQALNDLIEEELIETTKEQQEKVEPKKCTKNSSVPSMVKKSKMKSENSESESSQNIEKVELKGKHGKTIEKVEENDDETVFLVYPDGEDNYAGGEDENCDKTLYNDHLSFENESQSDGDIFSDIKSERYDMVKQEQRQEEKQHEKPSNEHYVKTYEMFEVNDVSSSEFIDENSIEELTYESLNQDDTDNTQSVLVDVTLMEEELLIPDNDNVIDTDASAKEPTILSRFRKSIRSKKPPSKKSKTAALDTRFFCVKCNRDFSTKTNLTRHMITHEGKRPYECKVCGKDFTQNGTLKQHMLIHTGERPYVCVVCNRGFSQCKSLIFHMRRHTGEKPFPCEKCGVFFRQKDGLRAHILKHHMITDRDGDVETHICIICKRILSTKTALQIHMKKHVNNHTNVKPSSSNAAQNNDFVYELMQDEDIINDSVMMNSDDINLNIENINSLTHIVDVMATSATEPSRAKKFQCRKCFKCFAIKKNLVRHLTIHDSSVAEMFECTDCEIAFDTEHVLKMHRERDHKESEDKMHYCHDCNLNFKSIEELIEHNNSHNFTCTECPTLNFSSQKQLVEHLLEHEINEEDV